MECEISLTQPYSVGHAMLHHQMVAHHKLIHIKLHLSSKCQLVAHHIQGPRKPEFTHRCHRYGCVVVVVIVIRRSPAGNAMHQRASARVRSERELNGMQCEEPGVRTE